MLLILLNARFVYATNCTAPPTALILVSANFETYLHLITIGWFGNCPFPKSLKIPKSVKSMHGALLVSFAHSSLFSSPINDHTLSKLITGRT
jgi:predicted metal-binding protein